MAQLISLAEFKNYVGYERTDKDDVLQAILDAVEAHLEKETTEKFRSQQAGITDEEYSGDGGNRLRLRNRASSISAIKVSSTRNWAAPDYTIATSDVALDPVDNRWLIRIVGGGFPEGILNIAVSYTAAVNTPSICKEAVKEAAALAWRLRGKEHVASESLGDLGSHVLEVDRYFSRLPMWRAAIAAFRPMVMA